MKAAVALPDGRLRIVASVAMMPKLSSVVWARTEVAVSPVATANAAPIRASFRMSHLLLFDCVLSFFK